VRRIQDSAKYGHTDAEKGCSRASGMAVIAGCRNIRGHLFRKPAVPVTSIPKPARYELDGSEFEPRWDGRFSLPLRTSIEAHSPLYFGYRLSFPATSGRGEALTTHRHLALR
jgi:hypothetical protein